MRTVCLSETGDEFSCSFAHPDNMDKYASVEFKTVGEEIRLSAAREKNN